MSYPKKIIKLRPTGGLAADLPPYEVGENFYTRGLNVHFRENYAERARGHTQVYDNLSDDVRHILNAPDGTDNYWLYFGVDSIYALETTNHDDITPGGGLTAVALNQWTAGLINGVPFANNGQDAPLFWDFNVANPMATLTDWPANTICGAMRAHRYNLFALNVSDAGGDYPSKVMWSASAPAGAIPSSWTAAATNDAGDAELSETPGGIIDAMNLRGSLLIYKQHSAYKADYIGGNSVYRFSPLFITAGMLAKNCAAEIDGLHYLLTDGDVVVTDGNQINSVIDSRMRQFIFNQIDQDNFTASFVVALPGRDEVWVCFPSAGADFCDLALIIDSSRGYPLGIRELPQITHAAIGVVDVSATSQVWDNDSEIWDADSTRWNEQNYETEIIKSLVLAQTDDATPSGKLLHVDSGLTFDGSHIEAFIGKHSMAFDEPNRVKFVRRIIPHVTAVVGTVIYVRVGSQMSSEDEITWADEIAFTVGTSIDVPAFIVGKFISVEFRSEGEETWQLAGFDVEGEVRGYY